MALVGGGNRRLAQVIAGQGETVVLLVHQQGFDLQIFRAKRIRQVIRQRVRRATRQIDAQLQPAVQLVHKLTAVAARSVVNGYGAQGFFTAQPGVADGALLGVHGLLHGCAQELHVAAEVPGAADAARNGPDVEVGEICSRAGGSQRKQCESQRVFVQSRCLFQHRDLLRGQQGGEVRICQNGSKG